MTLSDILLIVLTVNSFIGLYLTWKNKPTPAPRPTKRIRKPAAKKIEPTPGATS